MSLNRNPAILFLQGEIFQPKGNIKMKRHGNVIIKKSCFKDLVFYRCKNYVKPLQVFTLTTKQIIKFTFMFR